ncbi:MAG TPA: YdeI/OmpD-associated family protein [Acidimicrobiia bacterium]
MAAQVPDLPVQEFASAKAWERWLRANHAQAPGLWLKIAKKGTGVVTVDFVQAIEVALCYGWIDGLRHAHDETYFRQRFTPRKPRSKWSQINRDRVEALIAAGRMRPAGQAQVDVAKADGRWDAAYAGARTMEVPDDLTKALQRNTKARRAFAALDGTNRYSILFRIHDAKRPETRARRIEQFVTMLEEGRTIH